MIFIGNHCQQLHFTKLPCDVFTIACN